MARALRSPANALGTRAERGRLAAAPAGPAAPSRSGPEGPPRPFGAEPSPGSRPAPTSPRLALAQNHALLYGPFPRGGLVRGISDGALLMSGDARVRELALTRIRAAGASVVRIPVDWRYTVAPRPAGRVRRARSWRVPSTGFDPIDAAVRDTVAAGLSRCSWSRTRRPSRKRRSAGRTRTRAAGRRARRRSGSSPRRSRAATTAPSPTPWRRAGAAARAAVPGVERAQPRALPGAAVGRGAPALERLLAAALPPAAERLLRRGQVGAAERHGGRAPAWPPTANRPESGGWRRCTFLSGLLCLEGDARTRGGAPRASCPDPPHFDVLAFHPLSVGIPDLPARSSLDVAISDAAKVTALLARAERAAHRAAARAQAGVGDRAQLGKRAAAAHGVPGRLQARGSRAPCTGCGSRASGSWSGSSWSTPTPASDAGDADGRHHRIRAPRRPLQRRAVGGRSTAAARPKPFLQGFTLPFDPLRVDRAARARVGAADARRRAGAAATPACAAGAWRTIARLRADRDAVLNTLVRAARRRAAAPARRRAAERLGACRRRSGERR